MATPALRIGREPTEEGEGRCVEGGADERDVLAVAEARDARERRLLHGYVRRGEAIDEVAAESREKRGRGDEAHLRVVDPVAGVHHDQPVVGRHRPRHGGDGRTLEGFASRMRLAESDRLVPLPALEGDVRRS